MLPQLVAGRNYCHVVSAEQATVFFCTLLVMLCGAYLHAAVLSMFYCHVCDLLYANLATYDVVSFKCIKGGSQSVTVVIIALVLVTLLRLGGSNFACDLGVTDGLCSMSSGAGVLPRRCFKDCFCALYGSWGPCSLGFLNSAGC
jgi:hypothetical protein